jgi:plasmid rolling circle replication initiator protein Rep
MCHDNSIDPGEKSRVLIDKTKSGKERPWRQKKISNIGYFELLHVLEFKKSERVKECGTLLEFKAGDEGYLKLYKTWFCKSRLCSLCNWRRAMKHSGQTKAIVEEVVKRKPKARWLFFTFSVKNVYDGEELNKSLSEMARGFRKMIQYKKIDKNLIGFMRSTEVTVNETDKSYNQHIHVLMCVESTYFKDKKNYISQKEWVAFWRKSMKLDYDPIVYVEAVKPKGKNENDLVGAIKESAKYPVKDTDFKTDDAERNLEIVKDLEQGLHKKRLISYGGLLKEIHAELNLDDVEDGDLIHTDDDETEVDENAYSILATWNWRRQNYYFKD